MTDTVKILLGVALGALGTGFLNSVLMGSRITRLETIMHIVADKLDIKT